jgi:NPCBM-associated, NEW3 domain of alpha-galactosidase
VRRAARLLRLTCVALAAPTLVAARGVPADEALRLPSLVVDAEARAIITVQVPVPEGLRDLAEVAYVVRLLNGATIVGPTSGVMAVQRAASRALLLTLRVPHDVRAGDLDVAEVEFRGAGRAPVVQPVQVRIALRRQVLVSGAREVNGLRAGDRVDLVFRLVNEGNAPEALNVAVRVPNGWSTRPAVPRVVVIPRGEGVEIATTVSIPEHAGIGDYAVVLDAAASWPPSAAPVAQFRTVLRVLTNATTASGLMLTPIVATATGSDGSATFAGATLDGPLNESVQLRARLLPRVRSAGIVAQGLSAVGAFQGPFSASLSGRDWELAAGNALVQLSDLTGVNVIGEGLTASGERGEWQGRAVAARPSGGHGISGEVIGAGLWRAGDFGRVGGSASYLAERGGVARGRDLTALAAEYETRPLGALTLGAGLAYRESYGRVGAGYSMSASHERPSDRVMLSVTHAPGGSGAFARATDEVQLAFGRDFSERWSMDGAFARSHDKSNVFRAMDIDSWNAGQRFAFTPRSAATLRARSTAFDARSASGTFGSFGSGTRDLTAGYEWRRGLFALSAEGSLGEVSRRTELLGGRSVESVAAQRGARLFASRALRRLGTVDASVGLQLTQAGVGVPGDVWVGSARWAGIPLTSGRRAVRLDAEAQYQRLGTLQSFFITRSSVSMALPGGLDLAMTAERNPYYRDRNGRAGWMAAMRLSAGRLLRSSSPSGDEGVVYADQNGNGRRDPGEAGVAGVVLRRGDARVTSDREGRYRLPARVRGRTRVDQGSLPAGLLAHPLLAADTLERRDIPLLATGTVVLALRIFRDEDGRAPDVKLRDARVFLRDATGFEWVGRHADDSTLVFEDVPAGTYVPRFDFSMAAEPLRTDESLVVIVVPRERRTITVPLRGRAVRITIPPPRSGERGKLRG